MNRDLSQDNTDRYVEYINENILSKINYDLLQASYLTKNKSYAKGVLNALHKAAVEIYKTEMFDGFQDDEYVVIPGIIRSQNKGNLCVVLLEIDLLSSGEHCDTDFLTRYGCLPQFDENRDKKVSDFLKNTYSIYDYAYTLGIEDDIHVDFENLHHDMVEFLNDFKNHEFIPNDKIPKRNRTGNEIER